MSHKHAPDTCPHGCDGECREWHSYDDCPYETAKRVVEYAENGVLSPWAAEDAARRVLRRIGRGS